MAVNWTTVTVPAGNTTLTVVAAVDVDPLLSVNWNTNVWLVSRTASQFDVAFSVPAPAGATLTYLASLALISGTGITRTARQIVEGALRLCGIRVATETQRNEAFDALNEMLALWSAERLMVLGVSEDTFTLVQGTGVYTVGPTGTFNISRPQQIIAAYLRDSSGTDFPVDPTMALTEYNRISVKSTKSRPERLYYAPEFPLGKIHFDPAPDAAYTLRLFSWKPLVAISSLDTTIALPPEYAKALRLSLAVDIAPEYSVILDNTVVQQAVGAHLTIRNMNRLIPAAAAHDPAIVRELAR